MSDSFAILKTIDADSPIVICWGQNNGTKDAEVNENKY